MTRGDALEYEVRRNDTLWGIARQFNVSVKDLERWNNITDHLNLQIGRKIVVSHPQLPCVNNSKVCYISLSDDGYNVSYISRDMARTLVAAGECIELYSVPRDMARTLEAAGQFVEISLEVAGHISNGIGGFGTGMRRVGGTFRLTDGAYNGNNISIRHYESGWRGGSRAQIRTYNAVQWGSRFSRGGGIAGGFIGLGQVGYEWQQNDWDFNRNVQRKSAEVVGGIGGGIGGAKGGAVIGFAIGACFGGVGAPIGAVIGGVIGGVGGGFGGSWGGTKIYDLFVPDER